MYSKKTLLLIFFINSVIISQKINKPDSKEFFNSNYLNINNIVIKPTNVGNLDYINNFNNYFNGGAIWKTLQKPNHEIVIRPRLMGSWFN